MTAVGIHDSQVHGANMGPIWGRQDPGGPHVGPMNFAIWNIFATLITCRWFSEKCTIGLTNMHTTIKKAKTTSMEFEYIYIYIDLNVNIQITLLSQPQRPNRLDFFPNNYPTFKKSCILSIAKQPKYQQNVLKRELVVIRQHWIPQPYLNLAHISVMCF